MEKKTLGIAAISLLILLLPLNQRVLTEEERTISWKFEPRTDRSVHVEAVVGLTKSADSYRFLEVSKGIWIKNVKAYEYESQDPIEHNVYYDSEKNRQVIMLIFSEPVPVPFTFGIEFDLMDFMEEEKEKVFIFYWWYTSEEEESHTVVVSLPKGAELLDLWYLEPVEMEEGEQVTVHLDGKTKKHYDFDFQLVFSSSGKEYVRIAKRYEEMGDLDLALSYYQKAKSLYGRYNLISKTNPELLRELWEKICAIHKVQADSVFEEALEAFEQKEYEKARLQFEEAENLYKILEDTEKESQCREMIVVLMKIQADSAFEEAMEAFEQGNHGKAKIQFENLESQYKILKDTERESKCREMITACEKMLKLKEAETLLEKGKNQFETLQYPLAKESFIQAKDMFEELGDAEKVSECEEWLAKFEGAYEKILLCILGVVAILLALWERFHGFW